MATDTKYTLADIGLPDMEVAYGRTRLFPMYLCPFELFLYHDNKPDYPMTFIVELRLLGQVKKQEFHQAIEGALDRHRVLRSTIEPKKQGRLSWVYKKELPFHLRWQREGEPLECPEGIGFDPTAEAGVRTWVRQGDEKAYVTFYFNHVSVDGIGAHIFIGDLLAIYANLVDGPGTAELIELDPSLLKNRGFRQRYSGEANAHGRSTPFALSYLLRNGIIGGRPIFQPKLPPSEQKFRIPLFGIRSETFSREDHKALRDVAIRHGVTVNDLLTVETFMMMHEWNSRHKRFDPRLNTNFRIILPTNLRGRDDEAMPSVNMTSYNFIDRKPHRFPDRAALLKSIREETRDIKNKNLGTEFIEVVSHGAQTPWAMKLGTSGRRSLGSIVLTNVGDPTRRYTARIPRKKGVLIAGNLELEDCTGAPPLRDMTHAVVSITTYLRRLSISLRCDPLFFDETSRDEMFEILMNGMKSWLEE